MKHEIWGFVVYVWPGAIGLFLSRSRKFLFIIAKMNPLGQPSKPQEKLSILKTWETPQPKKDMAYKPLCEVAGGWTPPSPDLLA